MIDDITHLTKAEPLVLKLLAVEKDPVWQTSLVDLTDRTSNLELLAMVKNISLALDLIRSTPIDVLLLDIPSIEDPWSVILEEIPPRTAVLLTTNLPEHAARAFDLGITDLLLKPYQLGRFQMAMERAIDKISRSTHHVEPVPSEVRNVIAIRSGRRSVYIQTSEILYIEAIGNHVSIHLADRDIQANCTMKKMESILPVGKFTRVHRSYIVADHIVNEMDKSTLFTSAGEIPIGTAYRKLMLRSLDNGNKKDRSDHLFR